MKLKDIKISTQVKLGFGLVMIFVIMLGVISHLQTDKIHKQTEIMYNHPLRVRRALDTLKINVLNINIASKDMALAVTDQERHEANQIIMLSAAKALEQFNILREAYLGPQTDVEEAYKAFVKWRTAKKEYNKLEFSKQIPPENDSGASNVKLTVLREQLMISIQKIDDYAENKSAALFKASNDLFYSLTKELILLVTIILLCSLFTIYILLRNIRIPLNDLTYATQRFHNGYMDARSSYESKNKFGKLAASFNILAENIQKNSAKMAHQARELEARKKELQILSAQLLSAEEKERKRIASDVHDSIGQALSAIKFSIESSLLAINNNSISLAIESLNNTIPITKQSIDEVRRIIMDLRPTILDDLGLIATISWFCREFESIYTNISIDKEINIEEADISPTHKTVIYRILQEAFNNAAKHSRTDRIHLYLIKNTDEIELLIVDKGLGFKIDRAPDMPIEKIGLGLASLKERAKLSGGNFTIQSTPGVGTRIHVFWPVQVCGIDPK